MKVSSRLKAVTPTELFKQQVNNTMEYARSEGSSNVHIPVQFGGIFGQRTTLQEDIVVNIISVDGRV